MLKVGIVGLPNVGKSTLFNALLKKRVALSANYPFATIEPNTGVVEVPDDRLEMLGKLVQDEEKLPNIPPLVPAVVEFVDIAGLVKGASQGEGLGNQFLSHIREVDAIVHVLRDFQDSNIIRAGSADPDSDREVVETELGLADLQTLEKLIIAQEKDAKGSKDNLEKQKLEVLTSIKAKLDKGESTSAKADAGSSLRDYIKEYYSDDARLVNWYTKLPLLSTKPVMYVFNVSEEEYKEKAALSLGANQMVICAKLEEELADLTQEERLDYLKDLGIEQTGLERLITKSYDLLGLISFLTAGPKEVRAWTITKGTKAPAAAGVIHTDFEKAFIRAEVVTFDQLIAAGSYAAAKANGKMRLEGKDYEMKDGDVVEFRVGV